MTSLILLSGKSNTLCNSEMVCGILINPDATGVHETVVRGDAAAAVVVATAAADDENDAAAAGSTIGAPDSTPVDV